MMDRTARGTAVVNLLQLEPDEVVEALIDTQEFVADEFLLFVTRKGVIKRQRSLNTTRIEPMVS